MLARGGGHRAGVGVGREEGRPYGVDPAVGGLGTQHRDDEELERVVEVELDARVGVVDRERPVDLASPPHQAGAGLGRGHAVTRRQPTAAPTEPAGRPEGHV